MLIKLATMGIGSKISDFVCGILKNNDKRIFTKTVNPALGEYRNKSNNFKPSSKNGLIRKDHESDDAGKRLSRKSYCHEYIGDSIDGYEELLLPINEMRLKNKTNNF